MISHHSRRSPLLFLVKALQERNRSDSVTITDWKRATGRDQQTGSSVTIDTLGTFVSRTAKYSSPFISQLLLFIEIYIQILMGGVVLGCGGLRLELSDPVTGRLSQVLRLQLLMPRSSPVITLQSSLSLFRFDPITSGTVRGWAWYNPLGQLQATPKDVYVKGAASPAASHLQAYN